ncbi:PDR/VanB family oxidoreductase [Novacetimonas cocois]|uniref:Oxidoreductase n=1 Tax=Novacetimonas cocois TaxID=1747507 RepID=A0A365YY38_9PROT|nr:PDR/VanB family oxidoreductase [Novacetimonas cocois]RBM08279.1 oxidoreductase [Novacetimonas cocois]
MTSFLSAVIHDVAREGTDCIRLRLLAAEGQGPLPPYEAGAHIDVVTPAGPVRQYSLCGQPDALGTYELCIKRDATSRGGSESLFTQAKTGMALEISAPRNAFPMPEASRYILIAGGIGITPLMAMMGTLRHREADWRLYYYVREPANAPFRQDLAQDIASGRVMLATSLRNGYPDALEVPSPDAVVMLCGPNGFMDAVSSHAVSAGWRPDQVRREHFQPVEQPAGTSDRPFEVILSRTGRTVSIPAGQSIAYALLDAGIDVPLSCEQGMCGACVVPLLQGKGDHRDMILTQDEQERSIALCCSRARGSSLVLEL